MAAAGADICRKIKEAAQSKVNMPSRVAGTAGSNRGTVRLRHDRIVAIGSSTGGTDALREILTHLPPDIPPIVIAQHIPPVFSTAFAKRMSDLCPFEVKEAETGDELRAGRVLIAPGGLQMSVQSRRNSPLRVVIEQSTPEDRYKPSIDRLFESLAPIAGKQTIGVILTGMGTDGAKGLLSLRNAGARTIAQDEASCVVYGMPKEAVKVGAVEKVSSLTQIAHHLVQYLRKKAAA